MTERLLKGSEPETVERTLTYRGEALASVYVELNASDSTVTWPLASGTDLAALFEAYDEFARNAKTTVEWWIGDKFFEWRLPSLPSRPREIEFAARFVREQEEESGSPLDIVQLVCSDLVFEVTFGSEEVPAPATRLAVVVTSASEQLLSLFSRFHRNELVRTRPDIAVALMALLGKDFRMLPTH